MRDEKVRQALRRLVAEHDLLHALRLRQASALLPARMNDGKELIEQWRR